MKKKLKYVLVSILAISALGIVFYFNYLKSISVINHIPADSDFCLTINKKKFSKELIFLSNIERDTLIKSAGNNLLSTAEKLIKSTRINPLGEIAIFGKHKTYSIAWTGLSKKSFFNFINSQKLVEKHHKDFNYVKINSNYYLYYNFPLLVLSNNLPPNNSGFFYSESKKLTIQDLQNKSNQNSTIFGFIKPYSSASSIFNLLPIKEKAYISVNISENKTDIILHQENFKPDGIDFLPEIKDKCIMVVSCPWDTSFLKSIEILPSEIKRALLKIISKPIHHFNFEVLDTISSTEQMITYDMDNEFKLTQKIFYKYKTFPGLFVEFFKTYEDSLNLFKEKEFFKLKFKENPKSYLLQSGNKTYDKLPLYYFYANFELLRTDPFWKSYCISVIQKLIITSTPIGKGSKIKVSFTY